MYSLLGGRDDSLLQRLGLAADCGEPQFFQSIVSRRGFESGERVGQDSRQENPGIIKLGTWRASMVLIGPGT
jgi:hypothetical protein